MVLLIGILDLLRFLSRGGDAKSHMLGRRFGLVIRQIAAVSLRDTKHNLWLIEAIEVDHLDVELSGREDLEVLAVLLGKVEDQFPFIYLRVQSSSRYVFAQFGITNVVGSKLQAARGFNYGIVLHEQIDRGAIKERVSSDADGLLTS